MNFNKIKKTYLITILLFITLLISSYFIQIKFTKFCEIILKSDPGKYTSLEKCVNTQAAFYSNTLIELLQFLLIIFIILSLAKTISDIIEYIKKKYLNK